MRRIVHVDMDCFYAAIEQRDDPRLRGKAVAVGSPNARGVVMTASYEARRYGVGSAMPSRMAAERCPELIFVPPRMALYREVGLQIREIFRRTTDLVEPLSLDEAYLDVTEPKRGPPSGTLIAARLKREIRAATGLTASAGVSYCKFLAKIASGLDKPDGLRVIRPDEAEAFIAALPVERFHGVGPKTAERMRALGIRTGADLRRWSETALVERFGRAGHHFSRIARGVDERPVDPDRERKSVSSETTFDRDRSSLHELERDLPPIATDVARRLERAGVQGRGVALKLKDRDHRITTRQVLLPLPVRRDRQILAVARTVLRTRVRLERPIRLLGIGVYDLIEGDLLQPPLFPDWDPAGETSDEASPGANGGATPRSDADDEPAESGFTRPSS